MENIILNPNPLSSYFQIPSIGDRPSEWFHYCQLEVRPDADDQDDYDMIYTSEYDGRVFHMKMIMFDIDHWSEDQIEEFYAEWNHNIDSLIIVNP